MGTCCSQACCPTQSMKSVWPNGNPGPYVSGYKYNDSDPSEPCCKCAFTDDFCKGINSSYPHAGSDCGPCECDQKKVMTQMAGFDNCLKPVPPVGYRCPPDKPVWKDGSKGCKCVCETSSGDCKPYETFRADFCRCVCDKELIKCDGGDPCSSAPFSENPTPNYHSEDCSCKCDLNPANGGPGCGSGRKPTLNTNKCECECKYDVGPDKCPARYPYIMKDVCDCECPDSVSESCTSNEIFDVDTCSCKPCPIPCIDNETRKPGSCDCECLLTVSDCPKDEPYINQDHACKCYCPSNIPINCHSQKRRFDRDKCACGEYDASIMSILLEP